jgi:hypothetical protein
MKQQERWYMAMEIGKVFFLTFQYLLWHSPVYRNDHCKSISLRHQSTQNFDGLPNLNFSAAESKL